MRIGMEMEIRKDDDGDAYLLALFNATRSHFYAELLAQVLPALELGQVDAAVAAEEFDVGIERFDLTCALCLLGPCLMLG